jgi:hypothetical protein
MTNYYANVLRDACSQYNKSEMVRPPIQQATVLRVVSTLYPVHHGEICLSNTTVKIGISSALRDASLTIQTGRILLHINDLLFVSCVYKLRIDGGEMNYKKSNSETGAENQEKMCQHTSIKSSAKNPVQHHPRNDHKVDISDS